MRQLLVAALLALASARAHAFGGAVMGSAAQPSAALVLSSVTNNGNLTQNGAATFISSATFLANPTAINAASSVTASGFFGNGAGLTGVVSSVNSNTFGSSVTITSGGLDATGALTLRAASPLTSLSSVTVNAATLVSTVTNNGSLIQTGAATFISSVTISAPVSGVPALDITGNAVLRSGGTIATVAASSLTVSGPLLMTTGNVVTVSGAGAFAVGVASYSSPGTITSLFSLIGPTPGLGFPTSFTTTIGRPPAVFFNNSSANDDVAIIHSQAANTVAAIDIGHNRASDLTPTAVQTGDPLGQITFMGTDGTNWVKTASIQTNVDGTVAANSIATALGIFTGTSGNGTLRANWSSGGGLTSISSATFQAPILASTVTNTGSLNQQGAATFISSVTVSAPVSGVPALDVTGNVVLRSGGTVATVAASSLTVSGPLLMTAGNVVTVSGAGAFAVGVASYSSPGTITSLFSLIGPTPGLGFPTSFTTTIGRPPAVFFNNSSANDDFALIHSQAGNNVAALDIGHNRASDLTPTAVQTGDPLGQITFMGTDGTNWVKSASIQTNVDGTVAANSIPTALGIFTGSSGNGTLRANWSSGGGLTSISSATFQAPVLASTITNTGSLNQQGASTFISSITVSGALTASNTGITGLAGLTQISSITIQTQVGSPVLAMNLNAPSGGNGDVLTFGENGTARWQLGMLAQSFTGPTIPNHFRLFDLSRSAYVMLIDTNGAIAINGGAAVNSNGTLVVTSTSTTNATDVFQVQNNAGATQLAVQQGGQTTMYGATTITSSATIQGATLVSTFTNTGSLNQQGAAMFFSSASFLGAPTAAGFSNNTILGSTGTAVSPLHVTGNTNLFGQTTVAGASMTVTGSSGLSGAVCPSGNLCLNTTGTAQLNILSDAGSYQTLALGFAGGTTNGTINYGGGSVGTVADRNALTFNTNGSERFRIDSSGNFAIGKNSNIGSKLDVNGSAQFGGNLASTFSAAGMLSFPAGGGTLTQVTISGSSLTVNQVLASTVTNTGSLNQQGAATFVSSITANANLGFLNGAGVNTQFTVSGATATITGGSGASWSLQTSSGVNVTAGSIRFTGNGAPPTGQALCLNSNGNLSQCTTVVGAGGACTCP